VAEEEGLKTAASIRCSMDTNLQSPLKVKTALKGGLTETAGSFKSAIAGPVWPLAAARNMMLEKKHGAFTCTLSSSDSSRPVGSISGGKEIAGANVKGTLSSPAKWPMEPSGSFSVQKDIGPMSCTLKSASLPLKGSELGTVSLGEKINEFDCSLVGTISQEEGKVTIGNGKASVKRSVDTPIGPVCGVLETKVDAPLEKAVGTVSWKKTLGYVCCNLQATSKGAFSCTLDSGAKFTYKKTVATTAAPGGWFGGKSEVAPDGSTTIPVVALIGFAVGCILTFVMLRPGRGTLTAGEQQLLA